MKCYICTEKFGKYAKVDFDSKGRPFCKRHTDETDTKEPLEIAIENLQEAMK